MHSLYDLSRLSIFSYMYFLVSLTYVLAWAICQMRMGQGKCIEMGLAIRRILAQDNSICSLHLEKMHNFLMLAVDTDWGAGSISCCACLSLAACLGICHCDVCIRSSQAIVTQKGISLWQVYWPTGNSWESTWWLLLTWLFSPVISW